MNARKLKDVREKRKDTQRYIMIYRSASLLPTPLFNIVKEPLKNNHNLPLF